MPLTSGSRLGPYEILSSLGAGGMGEVYRARDTKLGREVAVKVLPEAWAFDADRATRFEREAQVLAALNHPHIAALYGTDQSAGRYFLVMELVEGETLAERLQRGPLSVRDALTIAHQIAEALEAAHEKGIVHRDLKPANVKITPNEQVKVLDFGLAKAMDPVAQGFPPSPGFGAAGSPTANLTNSPTLSMMATQAGVILGTAAYMSPEQAQGLAADQRSDVFSFGSVLYEMLTGRQPFQGDTAAALLASVLVREPDLGALPPNLNPRLPELLKRCLEKNPKRRWQAVGDLRAEIEVIAAAPHAAPLTTIVAAPRQPLWRRMAMLASAVVAGGIVTGAAVWLATRPAPPHVSRLTVTTSGVAALAINGGDRDLALTPDGTRVVYVGNSGTQLFVRALDALEPVAITKGAVRGPFVSPDGQWVGFFDDSTLKKVAITGGPPITLVRTNGNQRGATWAADDTIIFAAGISGGLRRVSASGGMPEALTSPAQGEANHSWPEILPGGGAVLFTITSQTGGLDAAQVAVRDLRTGTQQILLRGGSHAHYVASGHLLYIAAGTLRAVPFNLRRLETHGAPVPVVPGLVTTAAGAGDFAVSTDGTLVYVEAPVGLAERTARTLVWVDRMGKEEAIPAPPRTYTYPRLSPDGTRVALDIRDQQNDVWIWDLRRATLTRLTIEPGLDQSPVWTPDSRRLIFGSNRVGQLNLWWQAADGTGPADRLTTSSKTQNATGGAPDGTAVVFYENMLTMGGRDLMRLALDGTHKVTPLVQTKFEEQNGDVSPDGHWLVYQSDSSGRFEIYVRPFPNVSAGQWQVSTAGGRQPLWARSGNELFYVGPDGVLMRVSVEASGATWNVGTPIQLFEGRDFFFNMGLATSGRTYDVSPDGRRFLMIKAPGADATAAAPSLIVVQHWDEELKRLVPTTR
jgi:predicted Ser/Thr protein kinase